jgi:hypothetical protein
LSKPSATKCAMYAFLPVHNCFLCGSPLTPKVCKYPNKVQQQILNLSSMEHASSRVDGYIAKAQNSTFREHSGGGQQSWQKNNQRPQSRNSFGDNKRTGPQQEGNVPKKFKSALPTMLGKCVQNFLSTNPTKAFFFCQLKLPNHSDQRQV